jgi:hypothetical protein
LNALTKLNVANAPLPVSYETAKTAIAECARLDECKDWADKAEALRSYARQADDESLVKMANRIRDRALRRAGELLKQFDGRRENNPSGKAGTQKGGAPLLGPSQRDVAREAGMSADQQKNAVRIANIDEDEFEELVDGPNPPTVTELAQKGKKPREKKTEPALPAPPPRPHGFEQATHALGTLRRFAEFCETQDPAFVANGVLSHEVEEARVRVGVIDVWLDRFVTALKG